MTFGRVHATTSMLLCNPVIGGGGLIGTRMRRQQKTLVKTRVVREKSPYGFAKNLWSRLAALYVKALFWLNFRGGQQYKSTHRIANI
jgi:hypothetical protein